jgi:hypothetical protein
MVLLPMADGGLTLNWKGISPAQIAPVKPIIKAQGEHVFRFECSCGRDVQRTEFKLLDRVTALFKAAVSADPRATRVDLDITTI